MKSELLPILTSKFLNLSAKRERKVLYCTISCHIGIFTAFGVIMPGFRFMTDVMTNALDFLYSIIGKRIGLYSVGIS